MPPVGFESTISAGERSKTYTLDRAATRNGSKINITTAISYSLEGKEVAETFLALTLDFIRLLVSFNYYYASKIIV